MKIVIPAGGSGTRLWPYSRAARPKQLLDIVTPGRSMLQNTVERVLPLVSAEDIIVVTRRDLVAKVARQLPGIPRSNILGEPVGRGSAPAIGLAATYIMHRWGDDVMVSLHADHFVANEDAFRRALQAADQVARQDRLVTLGIVPTHPHTGLGHIKRGDHLGIVGGFPVYSIARFIEKPDLETATRLTASGEYYWNSGIFIWRAQVILGEMARYMPALSASLATVQAAMGTRAFTTMLRETWSRLATEQIDYGVMEHTSRGAVIPAEIGWSDVGDWNTLADVLHGQANADGNVVRGQHIGLDTERSIIYNTTTTLIATIGLEDMIIVHAGDVILICPRARHQDVRALVERLKYDKKESYL